MKIAKCIELFLLDAKIKRLKPRSIKTYTIHLQIFSSFCDTQNITEIEQVNTLFIKEYGLSLSDKSIAYQRNLLSMVSNLFTYLIQDELIAAKPKIKLPRKVIRIKEILSKEDIGRVIKACNNPKQRLMILMLLDTGMRISELIGLDIQQIDFETGVIHLLDTKSGERFVTIGNRVRKGLIIYLDDREKGPLFLTNSRKRYSLSGINRICKNIRKRSGVKYFTAHACRRTFITNSIRGKMPLDILMRLSGHTDFKTVREHYLKTETKDLIDAQEEHGLVDNL